MPENFPFPNLIVRCCPEDIGPKDNLRVELVIGRCDGSVSFIGTGGGTAMSLRLATRSSSDINEWTDCDFAILSCLSTF